jgi:hypothetical protein
MKLRNGLKTVTTVNKVKKRRRVYKQTKEIQQAIMDCILSEIEKAKEQRSLNTHDDSTDRVLSYGVAKNIIEKHKRANPWLNCDVLNNYKRQRQQEAKPPKAVIIKSSCTNVSELTNDTNITITEEVSTNNSSTFNPLINDTSDDTEKASINESATQIEKKGGRPKGSTNENIRVKARNLQKALNYAAMEALKVKEACAKDGNLRVNKGTYQSIVKQAEKKFCLDEGAIKLATVVNRLRSGRRIVAAGRGNVSPLVAAEAHFLEVILELANMRQPVTASGAMNIINSMIASSELQEDVIQ